MPQFDNFVVTGGTVSCHTDNLWCYQWRASYQIGYPLEWRHNGRDSVSIHQPHACLLKRYSADQRKHQSSASLAFGGEFTVDRRIPRTNGQ